jgi:hypothetical protein
MRSGFGRMVDEIYSAGGNTVGGVLLGDGISAAGEKH